MSTPIQALALVMVWSPNLSGGSTLNDTLSIPYTPQHTNTLFKNNILKITLYVPSLDEDECKIGTHTCQPGQKCINTLGAFACEGISRPGQDTCVAGYAYNSLSRTCEGKPVNNH